MPSVPRRGLGKGLGALLGGSQVATSATPDPVREIPIDKIVPNPFQPRRHFDEKSLDELKSSIAEYGVLVPVIVRPKGDGFELLAGERRWRACVALVRRTIPAIVRQSDDRDSLVVAIVENLQREDLNPLEEAAGFQNLMDEHGFTQDDVARRVGKSRPAIANALRLLALPDAVKAMLVDGELSAGHGRALLAAPPARRVALARRAAAEGLPVRALERLTGAVKSPVRQNAAGPAPAARELSPEERDFESRLRERYGVRVALVRGASGGRIEFRFGSEGELLRLGDLLLDDGR
ncbi:MAG: ParB/RepB/Spo0J family partition protein [Vulcanimicrobiaceae bacterium]